MIKTCIKLYPFDYLSIISYSKGMAKGSNFFKNIFSSLFGGNDPEAIKRRQLKAVAKELSKTKYHFYKANTNMADISMAKFFYEVYKTVSPAQAMFQNAAEPQLKRVLMQAILTDKQHAMIDALSEEGVVELGHNKDIKEVQKQLSQELHNLAMEFPAQRVRQIDDLYTRLILFSNFSKFDFYFILKKFDSHLRERDFNTLPHFQQIGAPYIVEDLKNFLDLAYALPMDSSWDELFAVLKKIRGSDPVTPNSWRKVMNHLRNLREKHVFEMIIQLVTEDPSYRQTVKYEEHHVVEDFLQGVRKQVESGLEKIKEQQTAGKIDKLLLQIFGTSDIPQLKYYNESNSGVFERKNFCGYLWADPLRYLKTFLLDFTKKDLREVSDILLVRGEWASQQMAAPMSEAYNQLLSISDKVLRLDEKLNETAEYGIKLKTYLPRAERDKEARNIINMVLGDANSEAANLILTAAKHYITYDRNLKMVLEDFVKAPHSEIIINWKELDHHAEGNLKQMCVDAYKKIYMFVTMIQTYNISTSAQQ